MTSTQNGTTHALLIGVDRYKSFDADLEGSRNDVVLLAPYCLEVLRIPAENIRVLTTPRLTHADLEQDARLHGLYHDRIELGDVTELEVQHGLAWLLEASKGGDGAALLSFSGHGAALPSGEPVLCLSDTATDFTSGVLSLKALGEDIERAGARDKLIALLDCCHVGSPSSHPKLRATSLPHAATTEAVESHDDVFRVSDRVLLAARPGQEAYQMRLGLLWHGALTFALMTAADRWKGENQVSHGSYKHVLARAKRTLKALHGQQKAELRAPKERRAAIRKSPFLGVKPGRTVRKPDAVHIGMQIDGGYRYAINAKDEAGKLIELAIIIAVGTKKSISIQLGSNPPWPQDGSSNAGFECWYVNTNNIQLLSSGRYSIVVTTKDKVSDLELIPSGFTGLDRQTTTSTPYIEVHETTSAGWVDTTPTTQATPVYFKSTSSSQGDALWMGWDILNGTLNQVIWYRITNARPTTPIDPMSYMPFAFQSSGPKSGTYYQSTSENNA